MANTFELIASKSTPTDGTTSITFSSIPATYTDLVLKISDRNTYGGTFVNLDINFNGAGYMTSVTYKSLLGSGSAASSDTTDFMISNGSTSTANTFSNSEIYISNYAGSTNKSFSADSVGENNATLAYSVMTAGLWSNTAAVTSIALRPTGSASFATYSTFYLYGVKNA